MSELTLEERAMFLWQEIEARYLSNEPTAKLIEQALLAERRLAMEEAAGIVADVRENRRMEFDERELATTYNDGLMFGTEVAEQALRAAAEKEVKHG